MNLRRISFASISFIMVIKTKPLIINAYRFQDHKFTIFKFTFFGLNSFVTFVFRISYALQNGLYRKFHSIKDSI